MPKDKSPLHPSALRLRDLHPGRRIITFNFEYGNSDRATIVSAPRVVESAGMGRSLMVKLRDDSGFTEDSTLADLGVIPYPQGWNSVNFTIDARKEHLLPKVDTHLPWRIELQKGQYYEYLNTPRYYKATSLM